MIECEEVCYVIGGQGKIGIDGHAREIGPGDIVIVVPGQRHKVWQQGATDLVLIVSCLPAYSADEVVLTD